jgi:hypothetical protein
MRVLGASDLIALAEKLCIQERLDGLDADALAAAYQGSGSVAEVRAVLAERTDHSQ